MNLTFFKKSFKRQAGFSLTEAMIGGALLAGVGLAGAYMVKNQTKAQQRVSLDQKLTIFHQNIIKQINNPLNCNASLYDFRGASSLPAGATIDGIYPGTDPEGLKGNMFTVTPDTAAPILLPGFIDGTRSWNLVTMSVARTVTATGPAIIRFTYELDPLRYPNARRVTKDVIINVRFNSTGALQECFNGQESSVNNLQNDLCKSLNYSGAITSGGGNAVAVWNEDTQTCDMVGDTTTKLKACPSGTVIEGIRSDGTVHCKPVAQGVNCDPLTARVKLIGGKMQIVCE